MGFGRLFEMIATELDEQYMHTVDDHLARLSFVACMTAALGTRKQRGSTTCSEAVGGPPTLVGEGSGLVSRQERLETLLRDGRS